MGIMYCGDYAQVEDKQDDYIYVGYNFQTCAHRLALPKLPNKKAWYLVLNTSETNEPFAEEAVRLENQQFFEIPAQTTVVLIGK